MLAYDPQTGVFQWRIDTGNAKPGAIAGTPNGKGYLVVRVKDRLIMAHRLAWFYAYGEWPKPFADHINGIRSDNRISNLREATKSQNMGNSRAHKRNTSGFKGVCFHKKSGRWVANISPNREHYYLGLFDTPEEAHAAYSAAAKKHYGEFARSA